MANGVGVVDDGAADVSVLYGEHMRAKGLVDVLIDDDGRELPSPAAKAGAGIVA